MAKTIFIHKNHEDVMQLPTGHSGVPQLDVGPTKHIKHHRMRLNRQR